MIRYEQMQRQDKEYAHGLLAIEAARMREIFSDIDECWKVDDEKDVTIAMSDVDSKLNEWQVELEETSLASNDAASIIDESDSHCPTAPTVMPISNMQLEEAHTSIKQMVKEEMEGLMSTDVEQLNDDQQRAFDIISWHLKESMEGKKLPQLLMMIPGEGGVGKSKLIQTITKVFQQREVGDWCIKGAYTGITASLIDGKTLHVLAGIPIHGGKQSAQTMKKL